MKDISLAVKHINWSMIGPKEWTNIEWTIYTDLSVDIKLSYNAKDQDQETKCKITEEMYKRLLDQVTLAKGNKNKVEASDGSAWEIIQYENGQEIWHRSPDYIHGISSFEEIASILNSLLPNER